MGPGTKNRGKKIPKKQRHGALEIHTDLHVRLFFYVRLFLLGLSRLSANKGSFFPRKMLQCRVAIVF